MKKISFWPIWDEIQKVRENEWVDKAIELANYYLSKDIYNVEAYMQLIDMYYIKWELEKAEKPVDFILSNQLSLEWIDKSFLYYIKAVLLSERTEWWEAKKYIKQAVKLNDTNIEFKRLLWTIEFWSWNKEKWYNIIKNIAEKFYKDADVLLDVVTMALNLWNKEDAKKFVKIYYDKKDEIWFFSKSRKYYDRKMANFRQVLFSDEFKW